MAKYEYKVLGLRHIDPNLMGGGEEESVKHIEKQLGEFAAEGFSLIPESFGVSMQTSHTDELPILILQREVQSDS